ncbi:hypothetical protein JL721_7963 [Aureococcus anophagefferens]|nr:hypothetical protein JL721_7963 [Aureococcus anophagefferens]
MESANAALYGSEKNLDVDNAKEWAAEKDRSLGAVRARAEATDRAFGAAAREAKELLAAAACSRRRGPEAGREHPDALGSLGAKRKQDVEADEARVLELERVVDAAGDRRPAGAAVAAFPAAFSEVVNAAVDDMMAAAAASPRPWTSRRRRSGCPAATTRHPAPPPRPGPGRIHGRRRAVWHTDDAPTQEPPPPAPSSAGPSWADGMDDKAEAAAAADAPW